MLRYSDLARMKEIQEMAFPETCVRIRITVKEDGYGGYIPDKEEVETFPCRRGIRGIPQEYLAQSVSKGTMTKIITVPVGSDIVRTDRLKVGGTTYEVTGFISIGAWETAMRCLCEVVS